MKPGILPQALLSLTLVACSGDPASTTDMAADGPGSSVSAARGSPEEMLDRARDVEDIGMQRKERLDETLDSPAD